VKSDNLALPAEAIISVTNRCDARCQMCNIWRLPRDEFLKADDYRKLPRTLKNVNVTGGEALLRPDIHDIILSIYEAADHPRIILATNGFRPEMTVRQVERLLRVIPELGIAVSMDGDPEMHNQIRGVPNAAKRALRTLEGLIALGIKDLRVGFTAIHRNVEHLPYVYDLANHLGVEFVATIAQKSDTYYAIQNLPELDMGKLAEGMNYVIDRQLRSARVKNWFRAFFAHGVVEFARTGKRITTCSAAEDFFFLSPQGDVYPCLTLPEKIGNIRNSRFEDIWYSRERKEIREKTRYCTDCWMMCTARTELRKNPLPALKWIAREKLARAR